MGRLHYRKNLVCFLFQSYSILLHETIVIKVQLCYLHDYALWYADMRRVLVVTTVPQVTL